ncbi:MAG: hypothetical protein GC180_11630 [Bacteroidetes bacterium]|nr:hypothetical protein [Bacteroidota bacterium]
MELLLFREKRINSNLLLNFVLSDEYLLVFSCRVCRGELGRFFYGRRIDFQFQFFELTLRPCSKKAKMKAFEEDGIDLLKLDQGINHLNWHLDTGFFSAFGGSLIEKGKIDAELSLERADRLFRGVLQIKGEVISTCDNCLEEIPISIGRSLEFVVKLADIPTEDDIDREIYYVVNSDPRFYISQHIYDLVHMALPLRKTCENPGNTNYCNKTVLEKLNTEDNEQSEGGDTDPRWDKLKDLFN